MLKRFTKKKTKNKLNDKIQDKSNSEKLDIIISEIKTIKIDIIKLNTKFSNFEEDFNKYKKQDSDFQEAHINNFIMSILNHNRSTYNTLLLPIKNIYNQYSKDALSELDGLILYTPNLKKMPNISNELLERAQSFHLSLKDNISQINTIFTKPYLIIVESKRSFDKHKVDMKLRQIYEFMNILSKLDKIDLSTTTPEFQKLIDTIQTKSELSINELTEIEILFIFGSDDIPLNLKEYIIEIEKGITKESYNNITTKLFNDNKTSVDNYINFMVESDNTQKPIKSKLKHYKTLDELKTIIKDNLSEFNMGYLTDYVTSYEDLEQHFRAFKGKIGITQFNTIEFPQLLQFTSKES
jgi:hypothetical protein